ncbi:hypothetical protein QUA56_06115 [Microcoleus sp. N3A4]|uniref:hypothetical protein n=1 Tax=Microcoleus sp. N3A4 TaxID=3055379 RepID=UPI002FCEE369
MSRKRCFREEMVRNLDRELRIPYEIPIEPYPAQKLRNLNAKKKPPQKDGTLALRYTPLITNNYQGNSTELGLAM